MYILLPFRHIDLSLWLNCEDTPHLADHYGAFRKLDRIWEAFRNLHNLRKFDFYFVEPRKFDDIPLETVRTAPQTDEEYVAWLEPMKMVSAVRAVTVHLNRPATKERLEAKKDQYGLHNVTFSNKNCDRSTT